MHCALCSTAENQSAKGALDPHENHKQVHHRKHRPRFASHNHRERTDDKSETAEYGEGGLRVRVRRQSCHLVESQSVGSAGSILQMPEKLHSPSEIQEIDRTWIRLLAQPLLLRRLLMIFYESIRVLRRKYEEAIRCSQLDA